MMNDIEFCYIPAGPFLMGNDEQDEMAFEDEQPSHQLDLPYGYWLARYPVTVAQFTVFIQESGYFPRDDKPLRDLPNCPVVNTSLRDIRPFRDWLDELWHQEGIISDTWKLTIPSEAEWEKAARGGFQVPEKPIIMPIGEIQHWEPEVRLKDNENTRRRYPWGDEPDPRRANFDQSGIDRASIIGRYPNGKSVYGCEEMSGNIREWTRSQHREYPYDPSDGREDMDETTRGIMFTVRGGGYSDFARSVRCSSRFYFAQGGRFDSMGFRLVVTPK